MDELYGQITNDVNPARRRVPLGSSGCEHDSHVLSVLRNRIIRRDNRLPGVVYSWRSVSGSLCRTDRRIRHCEYPQEHTPMVDRKSRVHRRRERQ